MPTTCANCVVGMGSCRAKPKLFRCTRPCSPSEEPAFGIWSLGTPLFVPRAPIFSSSVISDRMLVIRCSRGRFGSWNGYGVCAKAAAGPQSSSPASPNDVAFMVPQLP